MLLWPYIRDMDIEISGPKIDPWSNPYRSISEEF